MDRNGDPFDDDVVALVPTPADDVDDQGPWTRIRADDVDDVSLEIDGDLERVDGDDRRAFDQADREYSFSVEFDLDPDDPDDREFAAYLGRLFSGE